ncbi:MAG: B12-binding domain-containing radical SAM protein [Spirochaetes bacterium]|nr:B12-binding domain-containing radical SAM protein [Spirochaetota bacterium]
MSIITLVRPPCLISKGTLQGPITPPIGVAYLASSLLKAGHEAHIIDALGEAPFRHHPCFKGRMIAIGLSVIEILKRIPPRSEIIGLSCMFSQDWPYSHRILKAIRVQFPDALLIAGGEHVTAMADDLLRSCPEIDLCVLGEGEEAVVDIANALAAKGDFSRVAGLALRRNGNLLVTEPRARLRALDEIPPPAWELTPIHQYLDNDLGYGVDLGRSMPILATRGCPYQCTFCSNAAMWTPRWYARDPARVLDEIQHYLTHYRATNIDFFDLTAIVKREWILEFCALVKSRGMHFTWQLPSGTRSEAIDRDVCRALHEAGCRNMTYAPESGSPEVLRRIKKKVDLKNLMRSMRGAIREGMNVKTNIIIGFPDETKREVWQTIRFVCKMALAGIHDVSVSMFSPYPGSELFNQMKAAGKLPPLDEGYYLSLSSYTDITATIGWSENLTSRQLAFYRIFALLAFYSLQYAARPWRLVLLIVHFLGNKQVSRLDKSLHDFLKRKDDLPSA